MSYNSQKHGKAEYNKYMQIPESITSGVIEGLNSGSMLPDTRYAMYTYQVNSTPVSLSGATLAGVVGLDGSGDVKLSGDQLKVFDQETINQLIELNKEYSQLIRVSGNYTYVMKTDPGQGTLSGDPLWQIQRIYENGSDYDIEWADGNDNFDNAASAYLIKSYSL